MSRDIFTVIEQMIDRVPKDDPTSHSFLDELYNHLEKLSFVPPEQIYDFFQFQRVTKILIRHFGETPPTTGWQKDVYDAWMNNKIQRPKK